MMSCDKKFLLKCQQCPFLGRLTVSFYSVNMCITGEFSFQDIFRIISQTFLNRCFMIDFRKVRSP